MKTITGMLFIWIPLITMAQRDIPNPIQLNKKAKTNTVFGDFDGDKKQDTAKLVYHTINKSYGLQIAFANRKRRYFGMGVNKDAGLDNLDWIGKFSVIRKGTLVWDNVNESGEIIAEEQVIPSKKFYLPNDGIYMHANEACGGGILYFDKFQAKWVIQE